MKFSFPMLVLSSAFGALIGFGTLAQASVTVAVETAQTGEAKLQDLAQLLQFADNDSDDDNGQIGGDDDDAAVNCTGAGAGDDDEGEDDEGATCNGQHSPAPAGTVAPPANGLFNGTTGPKATING
jgi:hypothetical protein